MWQGRDFAPAMQLVGEFLERPSGISVWQGEEIGIRPAIDEVLLWIKRFD